MKSQTSFFNTSVLRKNLVRFAPLWALYTVFWLLIAIVGLDGIQSEASIARSWMNNVSSLSIFNILYAGLCAVLLFGDLFKTRMCNALHAMPLRREGWLLIHSVSALLFALIPYLVVSIFVSFRLPNFLPIAAVWFAVAMLQFLFFFGLACFSIMCAGNWLGAGAVYFILNFFFLLAYGVYFYLYSPLLHGIAQDSFNIVPFVPFLFLLGNEYVNISLLRDGIIRYSQTPWIYLLVCVGIGLALWALSIVLYRKRRLECAGDFVAFRPVAPIFLVFYTMGVGVVLFMIAESMNGRAGYSFLAIGLIVGFITGKMLLEKTIRVFRLKNFIGLLVMILVVAGTMVATWLDPLGITTRIPAAKNIIGAQIYSSADEYIYQSNPVAQQRLATDPAEIEELRALHKAMIEDSFHETSDTTCDVDVVYYLSNGATCKRSYFVDVDSQLGYALEAHLSDYKQVFFTNDWDTYTDAVTGAWFEGYYGTPLILPVNENSEYYFSPAQIPGLLAALRADCDAGYMAQDWSYFRNVKEEGVCWLTIKSDISKELPGNHTDDVRRVTLHITTECVNTVAYLKTLSE